MIQLTIRTPYKLKLNYPVSVAEITVDSHGKAGLDDIDVEVSELLEAADPPPLHEVEVLVAQAAEEGRVVRYPGCSVV